MTVSDNNNNKCIQITKTNQSITINFTQFDVLKMCVTTFCSTFHGTGKDILIQFRTLSVCVCVCVCLYVYGVCSDTPTLHTVVAN